MRKISKGELVRLSVSKCFTKEQGGDLDFPLTNWDSDEQGVVWTSRPITAEETQRWRNSELSKGMTSAGETKLPPQTVGVKLHRDRVYTVLRARASLGLGPATRPRLTKVFCSVTGEETYIKRDLLELA